MFKAVITEGTTIMNGNIEERLAGLLCYIDALLDMGVTKKIIREVIELSFEKDNKKNKKVETILDNDDVKIQKLDASNMSKEEVKQFFEKEILNKMFD